MNRKIFKTTIAMVAAAGVLIAVPALADRSTMPKPGMGSGMMGSSEQNRDTGQQMPGGPGYAYGMGPGMMGGYGGCGMGPGMPGGYGGYGMGPGMMGGYGGYGMGPGMPGGYGGYGMGPGMMGGYGGYGLGPGMMGYGSAPLLNLSDEQQAKASKIFDASRKKMWAAMGGMLEASSKLRELLSESTRNRAAISAAYKQVAELRQKMFELDLDTQEEFDRILTADQRKQLRRW